MSTLSCDSVSVGLFQALNQPARKTTMRFLLLLSVMCVLTPLFRTRTPITTISDLSLRNMDFAMNLYRKISSIHDKNIFFSPLSVSNSFAALLLASGGITHQEILNGLNLHHRVNETERLQSKPEFLPKLFQLLNKNITQNGSLKLDQGMAMFLQSQYQVEKTFCDHIKEFFGAEIKNVDFADTTNAIDFINAYIKQKTHNKIGDMISNLNPLTRLMLINTVFFQGKSNHFCDICFGTRPVVCAFEKKKIFFFFLQVPGRCLLIQTSLKMHPFTLTTTVLCKCQ